jgi:cyclopropane fatty-acyl-phospholipid synthase-like methyltransferase
MKPFSDACEENKQPILEVIKHYFSGATSILEIGSGTGQHAVYFAEHLPQVKWHCSDQIVYHDGINQWLADYRGSNIAGPYELDVKQADWPTQHFDGVFSANTTHIMSWPEVELMFRGIGLYLDQSSYFCLYGPFNYHGNYTSASNQRFDRFLKERDPNSGLREVDDLNRLATAAGLVLVNDHEMPVNNRTLVWQKS